MTICAAACAFFFLPAFLNAVAERLNLRSMLALAAAPPPECTCAGAAPYAFDKAVAYARGKARFRTAEAFAVPLFWTLVLSVFMLSGGEPFAGLRLSLVPPAAAGFFFVRALWALPFGIYETFVLERKHGFSTVGWRLFFSDECWKLLIGGLCAAAAGEAAVKVIEFFPDSLFIFFAAGSVAFSLAAALLAPLLLRCFFKHRKLGDGRLAERIGHLMERAGLRLKGIFVIDASTRSRHANALFLGIGPTKKILLYDTLLSALGEDEILGVIGHEAAHCRKKHLIRLFLLQQTLLLCAVWIGCCFLHARMTPGTDPGAAAASGFMLIFFLIEFFAAFFMPVFLFFARKFEFEADRSGAVYSGVPEGLASALLKLCAGNLSGLAQHPLYVALNMSHPPVLDRVRRLRSQFGE